MTQLPTPITIDVKLLQQPLAESVVTQLEANAAKLPTGEQDLCRWGDEGGYCP